MALLSRLFVLVAVALLPAIAIQGYNEFELRRSRQVEVQDQALHLAKLAAAEQQQIVQGVRQVLIALSELPAVRTQDAPACNAYFSAIKARYPAFLSFAVSDIGGRLFCTTANNHEPVSVAGRAYFANALTSGGFTVGEFLVGRLTGRKIIPFALPFYDDNGRMGGVVLASLSLDWLADDIARKGVEPGGALAIIDRNGTYLARYPDNDRFVGRKMPDDKWRSINHPGTANMRDLDGVKRIFGYSPLRADSGGLLVGIGLNKKRAFTEIAHRTQRGILLIILGTSLVLILTWLGARRFIHRPLGQLVDAANQWRLGDYARRVTIEERQSEIARVGDAFNTMAAALRDRERELRDAKEKAEDAAARITTIFESTTDSVIIFDRDWRITYVNERAKAQVADGRDLVGMDLWEAFPDAAESEAYRGYLDAMSDQRPASFETFSPLRNAWYEVNAFPSSQGVAVYFRDVTCHKHALEARRISEERLRLAIEAAAMGTWHWDLRTGEFLWSDRAKALFGLPPDSKMSYQDFLAAVHSEDRAQTYQAVKKSLYESGEYDSQFRVLWPDGSVHWLRSKGTARREDTGGLLRMQGVIYDIDAQRKAQEANAYLAAIVESSHDAIISVGVDGMIRTWNPAAERVYGYAAHEVIGRPVSIIVPPDHAEEAAACFQRASSGTAVAMETVRLRKSGEAIDVMLSIAPIQGLDGQTIAVCGMTHDITARKRMERALRERVGELQTVMDTVPVGVMIAHDPECRRMTGSRYANDLLKLPFATNLSKTAPAGEAPDNVRILRDGIEAPDEDLPPQIAAREGVEVRGVELELMFTDGTSRHVFCHAVPLWDANGKTRGAVGAFIDITDRKRAEKDLRRFSERLEHLVVERTQALGEANMRLHESESRFRAYFMHAPECLFDVEVTLDGRFIYAAVNPSAENAFGIRNEGLYGKSPEAVFGRAAGARQTEAFNRCVADGSYGYEDVVRAPSGDGHTYDVILVSVREGGRVARILGSARDITQRRLIEEQLHQSQKMEAVGQLTGGVAHDFNNLLTVVCGNLELIEGRAGDNDFVRRLAAAARQAADRGAKLTTQLLAFSRRQKLNPKLVYANHLIHEFQALMRRAVREAVEVKLVTDEQLWPCYVDPAQLETALLNLALNGRDAMPKGGVLTIEARNVVLDEDAIAGYADCAPGPHVSLSVADTGSGMPPATLVRVFEPFFTTKEVGRGTGLGLSMVYGFVKQSGGHITIESAVGVGTTVTLFLPKAKETSEIQAEAVEAQHVAVAAAAGSARILVVEDDEDVLKVTSAMLVELGYEVFSARNGTVALDMLRNGKGFDLLFSDVVMPQGMSGVELAREAKRLEKGIKVLLTTGYAGDVLARHQALDEFPIINKPFRPANLARSLRSVLREA